VYKKWRIRTPKLSIQHYTLIEKLMLNKPLTPPFFIHVVSGWAFQKLDKMEEIKNKILEEYKKGNIVVAGIEGLQGMPISEFIKQPVEGMLYDLNRNEAIVLTFLPDPKWINDYAVAQVIRALKNRIDELEGVS